jgi:hypothetical protein
MRDVGRGKYSPFFSSGKDEGYGREEKSKRRSKVYKEGREERVARDNRKR